MDETQERDTWSPTTENLFESQYPLHRACRDGDLEALSLLMSAGRACVFYQEDGLYGWTPIHWAAHFGKLTCLMRLIEQGCNCDHSTERLYQTPLHLAAQNGKGHCLKWLLHCGAAINRQDYMGDAPLHKCARTGNMECVSLLISQGTNLNIKNHNGLLPSQLAAESGHHECAAYIERAMQLEQSKGTDESQYTVNPSSNLRSEPSTERVVTNGYAMAEDEDMDTDLPVRNVAGTKRSREHSDEDECKKSRRDEPTSWDTFNGMLQTNGFTHHNTWTNQNGFNHQTTSFNHDTSKKYQNGFSLIPSESVDVKHINGILQQTNGHACNNNFMALSNSSSDHYSSISQSNGHVCNNNNIGLSNSSIEHYSSISQEQGYDCLLLDSLYTGNQYDGS